MTSFRKDGRSRSIAVWLFVVALMVFAMVVVGGATRLTGSGLSITQWKPVTGAVPPLSHEGWLDAFARYKATPQYRYLNQGMSLGQYQFIYWWEWTHRLLGRLVGVVFTVPEMVQVNEALAVSRLSETVTTTLLVAAAFGDTVPLIRPLTALMLNPVGRPTAE